MQYFAAQRFAPAPPQCGGTVPALVAQIIQAQQADGSGLLVQCLDVLALMRQLK